MYQSLFTERFEKAFCHLIMREGYYANVRGDRGGETYMGVARNYWPDLPQWNLIDQYKERIGRPLKRNERINSEIIEAKVKAFYKQNFWSKIKGDDIHSEALALLLFDSYVHSGSRAIEWVQQAANEVGAIALQVDRKFGPATLSAVNASDPHRLFVSLRDRRANFLTWLAENVAGQEKFRRGWMRRINDFKYVDYA